MVTTGASWTDPDVVEVRRIVFEALAGRQSRVFAFGSRVRGDSHSTSDLDLAISASPALAPGELAALREDLDQANVLLHVDVIDLHEAGAVLRERILGEGVEWHAATSA